jgi:arabinose operon protein AraL
VDLEKVRHLFLDINGTLLKWDETVLGAEDLVLEAREKGIDVKFVTDNSLLDREEWAEKLSENGIAAEPGDVVTVGNAADRFFRKNEMLEGYVIGSEGLHREISARNTEEANRVLLGFDRQFNYRKLERASEILEEGKLFICSNQEWFIVGDSLKPHQGPINRAFEGMAEAKNLGKPSEEFAQYMREELSFVPNATLMLGDRIEDVQLGRKLGIKTALTMSGRTNRDQVKKLERGQKPDIGVSNLSRLRKKL